MRDGRNYSYEEVLGQYRREVNSHINDAARIPARQDSPEQIYHFAQSLHKAVYKDALHPSVADEYKPKG